jgi:ribose 5-phosphate isomerase B
LDFDWDKSIKSKTKIYFRIFSQFIFKLLRQIPQFQTIGVRLMTQIPSEQEIHAIVERVLKQSIGEPTALKTIEQASPEATKKGKKVVVIGADHGGVDLKENLKQTLIANNYDVNDVGTHTKDSVDYPDIALAVSSQVASGKAWRGVIIDGAGIGSCMAANKVPGIRAALCYDYATAKNSREHNNANVLTLGAGLIGINLAKQILITWLATDFLGGRHARRVDKIMAIQDQQINNGK